MGSLPRTQSRKRQEGMHVERPLSFDVDRKNAFIALLQYTPYSQQKKLQNVPEMNMKTTPLSNVKSNAMTS